MMQIYHSIEEALSRRRLVELLAGIAGVRVGVVGDFSLDAYWHADMMRSEISREAPLFVRPIRAGALFAGRRGQCRLECGRPRRGAGGRVHHPWARLARRAALGRLERAGVRLDHSVTREDCVTPMYGK